MKKSLYFLAAVSTVLMAASCEKEGEGVSSRGTSNEISFVLGGTKTRSLESAASVKGSVISLGKVDDDTELVIEESVSSLEDAFEIATKGTPAYTENVASLYGSFKAYAVGAGSLDAVFTSGSAGWTKTYDFNPWDVANPIKYWMHMPSDMNGTGVSGLGCADGKNITFIYASPATASAQKDILFTTKELKRSDYESGKNHLLFYHALTGVKFAVGNTDGKTVIKKVEFVGLYGQGTCTVTPNYQDNVNTSTGNPSNSDVENGGINTKSSNCVSWTGLSGKDIKYSLESDGSLVNYTDDNYFADSFYAAGADKNLNDSKASLTFWFIPQTLDSSVKLNVTFTYDGTEYTQTVDFGEKTGGVTWKAGELRTYTIKATAVDVDITDTVEGMEKNNVVITNTGSADAYMRAAVVANWCNADGEIIAPWTGSISAGSGWVYNSNDGYYYYNASVAPGQNPAQALFESYSYTASDKPSVECHLEMDIAVQAIKKGSYTTYMAAWNGEAKVQF